jgi:hypothetical protein
MSGRFKAALDRGLGDRRTRVLAALLIVIGVLGKLVMRNLANFETVFVVCLLAGSVLGRWWTVLVPLAVLVLLEPILWGTDYAGYATNVVLGLSFFIVTGFLFVGLLGRAVKPRVLFRVKGLALLTTLSIPMTIAYDLWTDVGEYYFIAGPMGLTFWNVLELQVPFTIYHVLSSLIFVPLFGAGILYLFHVAWPSEVLTSRPSDQKSPAKDS